MTCKIPNKTYNTFNGIMLRYQYLKLIKYPTKLQERQIEAIEKWNSNKLIKQIGIDLP
jgi:hypothetical protein